MGVGREFVFFLRHICRVLLGHSATIETANIMVHHLSPQ